MALYYSIAKGKMLVRDQHEMFGTYVRWPSDGKYRTRFCYTYNIHKDWWRS